MMIFSAYESLNTAEREAVDNYVEVVRIYAQRNNELIIHALNREISPDLKARSRGQLEKPLVLAAIHEKITQLADNQDLAAKRILREHMILAMSNMADYVTFPQAYDPLQGKMISLGPVLNLEHCTREQMAAVKSIKITTGLFDVKTTIELHSKQASLDALGAMMGLNEPENPVYREHIAAPKDVKPLAITATPEQAEIAYNSLLESIKP